MIKNSAVRVHEILNKLKAYPNDSLASAWRKVLEVETLVDVFIGISKIDAQLMVIEERYREKERDTILIDSVIQEIRAFLSYERIDVSVSAFVNSALKDANISTIGMAELIFDNIDGENTIEQEKIDQISTIVDELMIEMEALEIDKKIKKLFLKVLYEMKISLKFYEIDGVASIEEALINLICKTKILEENSIANPFVNKIKNFLGYVGETIASTVIGKATESLYDSVIKGAIGN
jgi:hypothetical protein